MQCPRCGRTHNGICGIPGIGVKIGLGGVGIGRTSSKVNTDGFHIPNVPSQQKNWLDKGSPQRDAGLGT